MVVGLVALAVLLATVSSANDPFGKAVFDCNRIHVSFCCAARIRHSCRERCKDVQCLHDLKNSETASFSSSLEANVETETKPISEWLPNIRTIRKGKQDGHASSLSQRRQGTTPSPINIDLLTSGSESTRFPTLISMVPRTMTTEEGENAKIYFVTAMPMTIETATSTPPQKSIMLVPPPSVEGESLVALTGGTEEKSVESIPDVGGTVLSSIDGSSVPVAKASEESSLPSSFSTKLSNVGPGEEKFATWSIKVKQHETDPETQGSFATRNAAERNNTSAITQIGDLFGAYLASLSITKQSSSTSVPSIPSGSTGFGMSYGNNGEFFGKKGDLPSSITANVGAAKSISEPQCGVPPAFKPCVSIEEANKRLLRCCQSKLLPGGCQNLCRYDISQAEIKAALDAGQCGLLHVTPIVECASGGRDNTDCCRARGIAKKSGPQCEVFCRAGAIKGLGLQHLVCNVALNDLLICHHAGLRF